MAHPGFHPLGWFREPLPALSVEGGTSLLSRLKPKRKGPQHLMEVLQVAFSYGRSCGGASSIPSWGD